MSANWIKYVCLIVVAIAPTYILADLDDLDPSESEPSPIPQKREKTPLAPPPTFGEPQTTNPPGVSEKPQTKSKGQQSMKVAPEDPETARKQPIRLRSKGLKAQKDGAIVELQEDVLIVQGDLKLQSDYAKVFFEKATNEVVKAEATGHVVVQRESVIAVERMTAQAEKAVFLNAERKIVFSGNASVNRNGSILKGKKIFYDMKTGWITFEGAEGLMQPGREPSIETTPGK